jgi:hypothetical protein
MEEGEVVISMTVVFGMSSDSLVALQANTQAAVTGLKSGLAAALGVDPSLIVITKTVPDLLGGRRLAPWRRLDSSLSVDFDITADEAVEATVDALNAGDAEVVASLTSSVVTELAAAGVQVEITGATSEEVAKEPAADASDSWITPVVAVAEEDVSERTASPRTETTTSPASTTDTTTAPASTTPRPASSSGGSPSSSQSNTPASEGGDAGGSSYAVECDADCAETCYKVDGDDITEKDRPVCTVNDAERSDSCAKCDLFLHGTTASTVADKSSAKLLTLSATGTIWFWNV